MTILCAISDGATAWIGSDRLRSGGYRVIMDKPKFVLRGGWAIGVAGYSRAHDVVENTLDIPPAGDAFRLSLWLRDSLEADGFVRVEKQGDEGLAKNLGSGFLIATAGRVWDVDGSFALSPIPAGTMHAKGCGADYALGADSALRWLQDPKMTPKQRIMVAIAAAIEHDTGCGGPIFTQQLGA